MVYSTPMYGEENKRPLWQWVLLYVLIGGLIYAAVYYYFMQKNSNPYSAGTPAPTQQAYQAVPTAQTLPAGTTPTTTVSPVVSGTGALITTKKTAAGASYLVGSNGMTLYIFDKDTKGVSNCYGSCAQLWPPYMAGTQAATTLPAKVTIVTRTDGSKQYAYAGLPLYYYTPDQKPGDITGDGVGGVWHLVKP